MTAAVLLILFPLCMAYAAISDIVTMTIPNRVSALLVLSFFPLAFVMGMAPGAIAWHAAAGLVVFLGCFALFAANVMGGGDAKLLSAASLWFGLGAGLLDFLMLVAVLGGLLSIAILMMRSDRFLYLVSRIPMTDNLINPAKGIPYGIAIGAAGLLAYPDTPLMQQLIHQWAIG